MRHEPDLDDHGASSVLDRLIGLLTSLEEHSYGEDLDTLLHSLQTAARLRADGGSESLVLAGLLHDIGHALGGAGVWGAPQHAETGVDLQAMVPLIAVDVTGVVRRVTVNHRSMEPPRATADVDVFYAAYRTFCDLLAAPANTIESSARVGRGDRTR